MKAKSKRVSDLVPAIPKVAGALDQLSTEVSGLTSKDLGTKEVADKVMSGLLETKKKSRETFSDCEVRLSRLIFQLEKIGQPIPQELARQHKAIKVLAKLPKERRQRAETRAGVKSRRSPTAILNEVEREEPIDINERLRYVVDELQYRVSYSHCGDWEGVLKFLFRADLFSLRRAERRIEAMIQELQGLVATIAAEASKKIGKVAT
jgi:hypothetical protein